METPACVAIVTTVADRDEALRLGRALVERRLVACAQIEPIESIYRWRGAVQQEPECRLVLKTRRASYPAVERAIRELHRYELPAIHAVALDAIDAAYAGWIVDNTAGLVQDAPHPTSG